jgi:hypothetical protein
LEIIFFVLRSNTKKIISKYRIRRNAMPDQSVSKETDAAPEGALSEEIERIQLLLRRMDDSLAEHHDNISLKELAQAVHTAGDGGRSIAQLKKFAREMDSAKTDEEYEKARAGLFATLSKLGKWRSKKE